MNISMQVNENCYWDDCPAIMHEVKNWEQAVEFAYMMSKQVGRKTVRLVDCNLWGSTDHESFQEFVGAMSGTYIQSK